MSVATTWGTTPDERQMDFPCDLFMKQPETAYYRGITIRAQPELIFRWLCQLRVAPYSYDWIDNRGRQSPRVLPLALDELAIGQHLMGESEIIDFKRDRHLTLRTIPGSFQQRALGDTIATYLIVPEDSDRCRLLVKLVMQFPRGPLGWFLRVFLPWGDLIMMRKQLLNFKQLSEQTSNSELPGGSGSIHDDGS